MQRESDADGTGHADLSAREAATVLARMEGFQARLSMKGAAISWMFFGLAGAGIFATYGTIGPLFDTMGMPWLYALPWIPWIVAATLGTNALWRVLNITFDKPEHSDTRSGWLQSLIGSTGFFVIGAGLYLVVDRLLGLSMSMHVIMLFAVGIFTAALALFQARMFCAPVLRVPFVLAGAALFATGLVLAALDTDHAVAGVTATIADLTVYFAAAIYVFRAG